jgi:hypothetical protein
MLDVNTVINFNSPIRKIDGSAELLGSSVTSGSGSVINAYNVDATNRIATTDRAVMCLGKNLINYKTIEWLGGYDGEYIDNDISAAVQNDAFYTRLYPTENKWIKSGTKYTFSLEAVSFDVIANPYTYTVIEMVVVYTDDTYTSDSYRFIDCGRGGVTIATDATKTIKYIELKPIKGVGERRVAARVKDIQLSIVNDISYQEYQEPVESVADEIELFAPVSTVYSKNGFSANLTYTADRKIFSAADALKHISIERSGAEKFFGFGVSHKLKLNLLDKERYINICKENIFNIVFDENDVFPHFTVDEVTRDENTNELTITAYDALNKAQQHTVSELSLPESYNIMGFAEACGELLGVAGVVFPENTDVSGFWLWFEEGIGVNFNGDQTIREALNAVADATQTIYYINDENKLVFKRLNNQEEAVIYDFKIIKDSYFTLKSKENRTLTNIISTTELGDNYSATSDTSGYTQYIRNNAF